MNNTQGQKSSLASKEIILFKSISIIDRYNFYEYLAVMVDSGVTISDALESVVLRMNNVFFKQKIAELKTYVSSGDSFSKAMRKIPQVFDIGEVSIIEAGETTGMLVESLQKLSDDLKRMHDLRSKVKTALTYPAIIVVFLVLAVVIVLAYVIPSLLPLFATAEVELPFATKALVATSDFLVHNYLYLLFFIFAIVVGFIAYTSTSEGKKNVNGLFLSLPLLGKVYQNYVLAATSASMGTLVGAGVNIIKTLRLTSKTSGSVVYENLFTQVIEKVSHGSKIVTAMEEVDPESKYFPVDFLQMLSVGEKTAKLEEINKKIHAQYMREVDYSLATLTKWIEPLAILFAGSFVLWFAFAIFGAILKITQTVS